MKSFDSRKIIFLFLGLLTFSSALISGSIYSWYKEAFIFAASFLFLMSLAAGPPPARLAFLFLPAAITWLSSLWTVNLNNTIEQAFFLTAMAFWGFAAASAGGRWKEPLLKILAFVAAAVSIYGIYQYFIGFGHTEEFLRQSGTLGVQDMRALSILNSRRVFSTMMSPNILACYLAVAATVIFAFLLKEKKIIYGLALTAVLFALFLTKSVGGLLALAGGLSVLALLLFVNGRLKAKPVAAVAIVLVLAIGGIFLSVQKRSVGEFPFKNSIKQRTNYYSASLEISKEDLLLGRGAGSFQILYTGFKKPGADETHYSHNLFLQYLAEEGLLGILAVAALFVFFFYCCLKKMRERPEEAIIIAGVASGVAAFLIDNLADFSWYVPETAMVFWLLAGLAVSLEDGGPVANAKVARFAIAGLTSVFIFFFSMNYRSHSCQLDSLVLLREAGITTAAAARSQPVPPEAVSLAEKAVGLKPYDDGLHAFLAGLYEGRAFIDGPGLARKAEYEYLEAIRLNPEYPFHYRDLGILYLKLGQKEKALKVFRKAVSLYPANKSLNDYLSFAENK